MNHPENDPRDEPGRSTSRASCPPPEVIIDHGLNVLSDTVRKRVEDHLGTCRQCAIEVRALSAALAAKLGPTSPDTPAAGAG